jgi:SpoIID/LytB domain protein
VNAARRRFLVLAVAVASVMAHPRPADVAAQTAPIPATLRIGLLRGGSYDVSSMPLETYVARVLAGEAARDSPPSALEALAVAIRTFALANRGRHRADGFDMCDQTHCQVVRQATAATERAAQATAGQALYFGGELASIYYSASCGGRSARPSLVWPGAIDPPYLPVQNDQACEGQPEWEVEIRASDLQRGLTNAGFKGSLRSARVASRDDSGRVAKIRLDGLTPSEISAQELRIALLQVAGLPQVQSAAFELRQAGDGYRFTGHGYGHGVGMCVIGSVNMAASGATAASILGQYFPGTTIGPSGPRLTAAPSTPPARTTTPAAAAAPAPVAAPTVPAPVRPEIVVWLPGGEEGERDSLLKLASTARDELSATLGVPTPMRMTLRAHQTNGEFERATGQSWFTSGAVVGGEVHLAPLQTLRDRGMLERTLRRQIAEVLTAPALATRPRWVQEGAWLFFGDGATTASRTESRVVCPTDAELARPVSAGALADAWSRARACFSRQMASGRSWRDIK